jgi:hypothetical protein
LIQQGESKTMATIERRLTELERATHGGLLVMFVDDVPTEDQRRTIEEAEAQGRIVVRLTPGEAGTL